MTFPDLSHMYTDQSIYAVRVDKMQACHCNNQGIVEQAHARITVVNSAILRAYISQSE